MELAVDIHKSSELEIIIFSQRVSLTQYMVLLVRLPVCPPVPSSLFCLIPLGDTPGHLGDRRHPSMEDDLQRKTTFDGRQHSMEDNIQ